MGTQITASTKYRVSRKATRPLIKAKSSRSTVARARLAEPIPARLLDDPAVLSVIAKRIGTDVTMEHGSIILRSPIHVTRHRLGAVHRIVGRQGRLTLAEERPVPEPLTVAEWVHQIELAHSEVVPEWAHEDRLRAELHNEFH